jgi:hypothetical protein
MDHISFPIVVHITDIDGNMGNGRPLFVPKEQEVARSEGLDVSHGDAIGDPVGLVDTAMSNVESGGLPRGMT